MGISGIKVEVPEKLLCQTPLKSGKSLPVSCDRAGDTRKRQAPNMTIFSLFNILMFIVSNYIWIVWLVLLDLFD